MAGNLVDSNQAINNYLIVHKLDYAGTVSHQLLEQLTPQKGKKCIVHTRQLRCIYIHMLLDYIVA